MRGGLSVSDREGKETVPVARLEAHKADPAICQPLSPFMCRAC